MVGLEKLKCIVNTHLFTEIVSDGDSSGLYRYVVSQVPLYCLFVSHNLICLNKTKEVY